MDDLRLLAQIIAKEIKKIGFNIAIYPVPIPNDHLGLRKILHWHIEFALDEHLGNVEVYCDKVVCGRSMGRECILSPGDVDLLDSICSIAVATRQDREGWPCAQRKK